MKMMTMKMVALIGSAGIMGYFYLKKHPNMISMMKNKGKEVTRKIYNYLDEQG